MKTMNIRLGLLILMIASAGIVFGQPQQNSHHNIEYGYNAYHNTAVQPDDRSNIRDFQRISHQLEDAFFHHNHKQVKILARRISYMMMEEVRESRYLVKVLERELERSTKRLHILERRIAGSHGHHSHSYNSTKLREARMDVRTDRQKLLRMRNILSTQSHLRRDFENLMERGNHHQHGKRKIALRLTDEFMQSMEEGIFLAKGITGGYYVCGTHGGSQVNGYYSGGPR